jgi:hypothetical protein
MSLTSACEVSLLSAFKHDEEKKGKRVALDLSKTVTKTDKSNCLLLQGLTKIDNQSNKVSKFCFLYIWSEKMLFLKLKLLTLVGKIWLPY